MELQEVINYCQDRIDAQKESEAARLKQQIAPDQEMERGGYPMSTPQTTPGTTTIPPINKVLQRLRWQEFEMICIRKSLELVRELIELADMEDDEGYNLFEEDKGEVMSVINESFITAAAGVF